MNVVLCDCGAASEQQRVLAGRAAALLERTGARTLRLSDLCGAVARRDPRLADFAAQRPLVVIACRPRAVRWLLTAAGIPEAAQAEVVDLRASAAEVRSTLERALGAALPPDDCVVAPSIAAAGPAESAPHEGGWVPWFPVIDEDRCTRCGQCASYCVFGVYTVRDDGAVAVARPRACKTGCPACARICPAAAIVFPKHDEAPFDGSAITDEEAVRARTRHNAQQALGRDPYATLESRRRRAELLLRPRRASAGEAP